MIYFIAAETFAIKIGYSKNPVSRIKNIAVEQFHKTGGPRPSTLTARRYCPDAIRYWAVEHPNTPFFYEAPRKTPLYERVKTLSNKHIPKGRGVYKQDVNFITDCERTLSLNHRLNDKKTAKLLEILDRIEKAVA
jgi:hypothetical protein